MGALKKCPRFYQYNIVEGWAPKGEQVHLHFGILYHASLERYDHARAEQKSHDEATRIAVRYALENTWDVGLGRPWISDHNQKNRATLVRSIVWYLDQFGADDPFKTIILANGKPAVELSFRLELDYSAHMTGETFLLCGHLDRLVEYQEKVYISDRKTTGHTLDERYYEQFSPDNQFSTYVFAGKVVYAKPIEGIIADAAQIAVSFSRFERRTIPRAQSQLDEWHRDLGYWLNNAQGYAKANYWPQNDRACYGCTYRSICSKPPQVRDQWLAANFVKRQWNPLAVRGDI